MKTQPSFSKTRGFALVVTLSLMILLTIIAVGLLALSSISLRTAGQGEAMATARSNARLALMMALGDIQKLTGPDRAITAPASLVDEKHPSGVTGVWGSWDDAAASPTTRSSTLRDGKFKQWLVSTVDGKVPMDGKLPPLAKFGSANSVPLLGDGSLGERATVKYDDQRISLNPTRLVNGKSISGIAWAVIDENAKARVDLYKDPDSVKTWTNVARAGSPPVEGVRTLPGWDNFAIRKADNGKLISLASMSLNDSVTKKDVSVCDPDVTVFSNSLMTDPVSGGLKKDLSMFSSRGLSSTENNSRLYKSAGVITDTVPSDPLLPLLASYHQLYKKLGVPDGIVKPGTNGVAARLPGRHTPYSEPDALAAAKITPTRATPTEPLLVPSVVRVDIIFSMITRKTHGTWANQYGADKYLLHLQYLPVVTLHNPYSVPLAFEGMRVVFKNLPVGFNFMVDGRELSTQLVALNQMYAQFAGSDATSKNFGVNLKASIGGSAQTITMQPGQTKLFGMPKVSPDWTWLQESPGSGADGVNLFDWRNDKTANFDMAPTMITPPTGGGAGFDIDWINPQSLQTAKGLEVSQGGNRGMARLLGTEKLGVKFGPYPPPAGGGSFTIAIDLLKNASSSSPTIVKAGGIEVRYGTGDKTKDTARLNTLLSKGTSVRFPTARSFPEVFPKPNVDPDITVAGIYEDGNTKLKDYAKSKQFMIFSVAAKTTLESFIPSKTLIAGNPTSNISIIDLRDGKDPDGGVPLEMVMMPIRAGAAAIEEKRDEMQNGRSVLLQEGFFFGGNGSLNGTPRATLYEFPMAPAQSLAQFRHANLAGSGFMPFVTYTAGESMAHPQIGTSVLRERWTDGSVMLDHTYLANEALWDHYFLSTVAEQYGPLFGTTKAYTDVLTDFFSGKSKLLNERFIAYNSGSKSVPADVAETAAGNSSYQKLAAYLTLNGGFNVNSTSEDAWKAVLGAMDEADVDTVLGVDKGSKDRYAVLRVRRPSETNIDDNPASPLERNPQRNWQGFRKLNEDQIKELATEIVKEIRTRGPFLSLADFVNRGIGAEGDLTIKGAVQAAIDNTTINKSMERGGKELTSADVASNGYKSMQAGIRNSASHAPGFVTQGDVLSSIGSRITVRADTFRIRGYGESRDVSGQKVLASAWCEAIVQRVPDFVDPSDLSHVQFTSLNETNKKFGRRYQIVSFRWLAQKEV